MSLSENGVFKNWWVALIFGILGIALGVFMFMNPVETYKVLSYLFAIYFLIYGVATMVGTFMSREFIPAWGWSFAFGVLLTIMGVMLFMPGMATGTFVFYIGFSVMFMGINACSMSFALKGEGDKGWIWTFVLGVFTIILSFIMINHPVFSVGVISIWAAIAFISLGCALCILAYRMSKLHSISKKL